MKPWTWQFEERVDASPWIVVENYFDEEHVTSLHGRHIVSSRILERSGRSALHEMRTRILGVPVSHLEWIQLNPPGELVFRSRALLGTMEVRAVLRIEPDGAGSRIRTDYEVRAAWFWRPFKRLILGRMQAWKRSVWAEDRGLLLRRERLFRSGFQGGLLRTMVELPPRPGLPPEPPAPEGWVGVCGLREVREKGRVQAWVDARREACALWRDGELSVIDSVCPHAGGPLGEGALEGGAEPALRCPWHGRVFRLRDEIRRYPHQVEGDAVRIRP